MKIITVTKEDKNKLSYRNNLDFIGLLSNYFDYKEIPVFNRKTKNVFINPSKIKKEKPDMVICHTHNKLLDGYFSDMSCLKVMVAVDMFKLVDFSFYEKNKFDLIIHRHCYEKNKIPFDSVWLPYSSNQNEFFPMKFHKHKKRVGYAGNWKPKLYVQRRKAINILEKNNLIYNYGKVGPKEYPNILRKNRMMLNSNELESPFAKVFEIINNGSLLLSPMFPGSKRLFLDGLYATYKDDLSDIVDITKHYLKNEEETKDIIKKSYKIVEKYHTHEKRIIELKNVLLDLYEGRKVKENW